MKFISSTDLKNWASTNSARENLPELIKRLIYANITDRKNLLKISFPSGEAISTPGWDGILECSESIFSIEKGTSLWECGTDKDITQKANSDYDKRTRNQLGMDSKSSTFVFVTPRIWNNASRWETEKNLEGKWKKVSVITAIELEDWLEQTPQVAIWLYSLIHNNATMINLYSPEEYWNRFASNDKYTIKAEIITGGRTNEARRLLERLTTPSATLIQSYTTKESMAFAAACIILYAPEEIKNKCIITEDKKTFESLINNYTDLILITNITERDHAFATKKRHRIVYAVTPGQINESENILRLPQIDQGCFIKALQESGILLEEAYSLCKECSAGIMPLRRKLGIDSSASEWLKGDNINLIVPALLTGCWIDDFNGDREIVESLSDISYDKYTEDLNTLSNNPDSHLNRVDNAWKFISPYEIFEALDKLGYFTQRKLNPFYDAISTVFSTPLTDKQYSNAIRHGLLQSATILSTIGKYKYQKGTDNTIGKLLETSDIDWWKTNSMYLKLIAEASPYKFVTFINEDIRKENSVIKNFIQTEPYCHYADAIPQALFQLSWSKELLYKTCHTLLQLAEISDFTFSRPAIFLQRVFNPLEHRTVLNAQQRTDTLTTLSKEYPAQIFKLSMSLLEDLCKDLHYVTPIISTWRYSDIQYIKPTPDEVSLSIKGLCNLVIKLCSNTPEEFIGIINIADNETIGASNREMLIGFLEKHKDFFKNDSQVMTRIQKLIHHNQTYRHTGQTIPQKELERWESMFTDSSSDNLTIKYQWIFESPYLEIPETYESNLSYRQVREIKDKYYREAVKDILNQCQGVLKGLYQFAEQVKCPDLVGEGYFLNAYTSEDFIRFSEFINPLDQTEVLKKFAQGFYKLSFYRNGSVAYMNSLKDISGLYNANILSLTAIPATITIGRYVDTLSSELQTAYWNKVPFQNYSNADETSYFVNKCNAFHRYACSISILHFYTTDSGNNNLIPGKIILQALRGLFDSRTPIYRSSTSADISDIIKHLESRNDINSDDLMSIELLYIDCIIDTDDLDSLTLTKKLLSDPEYMIDLIDKIYNYQEIDNYLRVHIEHSFDNLIQRTSSAPFCNKDGSVRNESALNRYIDRLRELGQSIDQRHLDSLDLFSSQVDSIIGRLLAKFPLNKDYPQSALCEILERLNSKHTNSSFFNALCELNILHMRMPGDGGRIEKTKSDRFKIYADKIRSRFPNTAEIFDNLSDYYIRKALYQYTEANKERLACL